MSEQQGFVVGKPEMEPKSIIRITEFKPYLVEYVDGTGRKQVRAVFDVPEADAVFVMSPSGNATNTMNPATGWFKKAVKTALGTAHEADDEAESI